MTLWVAEAKKLRAAMPAEERDALDRHEAAGTTDDPQYLAATAAFYARHVCRVIPNPPEVLRTNEHLLNDPTVYHAMNGPNEFFVIGTLRDWTVVDEVQRISVPTLLASGRYDEATPATVQPYFDAIPDVRWEIFEASSHMPFVEEPERYLEVVGAFLSQFDG
jgi:L-proline amide hydrolase